MRRPRARTKGGGCLPALPALVQGPLYLATGLWPLVDMRSFLWVTGPKTDLWLVKTVGGLIAVVGGALTLAGLRGCVGPETASLAVSSAAFLTAIDVTYVSKRRISRVYLLDAAAELGLIALWAAAPGRRTQTGPKQGAKLES